MNAAATLHPAKAPAAVYLAAALVALAREEHRGWKPRRLLEAGLATWQRFRGRLRALDLVELVLEDAAVTQPEPFDAPALLGATRPFEDLPEDAIAAYLADLPGLPFAAPDREYLEAQAARLGVQARPAWSDLPRLDSQHRVLELPGTGGRLSAHLVLGRPGPLFKEVFMISCATWQERMLAGLVAVELRGRPRIALDPELTRARAAEGGFTHVIGLRPEKGGAFDLQDLKGWFGTGTSVVLV